MNGPYEYRVYSEEKGDAATSLNSLNSLNSGAISVHAINSVVSITNSSSVKNSMDARSEVIERKITPNDILKSRMKRKLWPSQRWLINEFRKAEKGDYIHLSTGDIIQSRVRVIGDKPGAGKTAAILGLLCLTPAISSDTPSYVLNQDVYIQKGANQLGTINILSHHKVTYLDRCNLIVVPLSIIGQWESEILNYTNLTYKVIRQRSDISRFEYYEVILCTPTMYNNVASMFEGAKFKRFIMDEMDTNKISGMLHINADFTWFISATFMSTLQNIMHSRNVHFMKQTFSKIISLDYENTDFINAITIKAPPELIAKNHIPDQYSTVYHELTKSVAEFRAVLEPELKAMIDAGHVHEVIKRLGGSVENESLPEIMKRYYKTKHREAEAKIRLHEGKEIQKEWIRKADELQTKIDVIDSGMASIVTQDCPICMDKCECPTYYTCCQNVTCGRCAITLKKDDKPCPFCRNAGYNIICSNESMVSLRDADEVKISKVTILDKYTTLTNIVRQRSKILLYSTYDDQFPQIVQALKEGDFPFYIVKGTAKQRAKMVDDYINGSTKVLILNSIDSGAGLNLQITTDIVLWHVMNKSLTTQIIGRALRPGLDHELVVHKFYTPEEEIEYQEMTDE
jgi:SNF2 family DNA or RNA helicase